MNLPKSTEVNKFIPKNTFYKRIAVSTAVKREFKELIEKIVWKYKISEETFNITTTEELKEIQIFEIYLKNKEIPKKAIKLIDKYIPYPILFKVKYNDEFCYSTIFTNDTLNIEKIYISEWNEVIEFNFSAINIKFLYQEIISRFTREFNKTDKFEENIIKNTRYDELYDDIIKLQRKLKSEKQFNKKVELNKELNKKNAELEVLVNG